MNSVGDEAVRLQLLRRLHSKKDGSSVSGEGLSGGAELEDITTGKRKKLKEYKKKPKTFEYSTLKFVKNPKTGRSILKTSKLGKQILAEQELMRQPQATNIEEIKPQMITNELPVIESIKKRRKSKKAVPKSSKAKKPKAKKPKAKKVVSKSPKVGNEKYIKNPATGRYVLRYGKVGCEIHHAKLMAKRERYIDPELIKQGSSYVKKSSKVGKKYKQNEKH